LRPGWRDALGRLVYVNKRSQLLLSDGAAVPNAFALGLAVGYDHAGRFGEPSFKGQANGVSLWFDELAADILAAIAAGAPRRLEVVAADRRPAGLAPRLSPARRGEAVRAPAASTRGVANAIARSAQQQLPPSSTGPRPPDR
jgi:hypothetical protein